MNFYIEHPKALYILLLVIPMLFILTVKYLKIVKGLQLQGEKARGDSKLKRIKKCFCFRTIFRTLALISLVLALSGISWGVSSVPAHRTGYAVSLVFDVSYSMLARDCPDDETRLRFATAYAKALIEYIKGKALISVVATKGNSSILVPLTEDIEAIYTALDTLSPSSSSGAGSNLASGIRRAVASFPSTTSQASSIWFFTDGDTKDESFVSALTEASNMGIPVKIIGIGSERESTVLAGDKVTEVNTALRSESLVSAVDYVRKHCLDRTLSAPEYIDATEVGSAHRLLKSINNLS